MVERVVRNDEAMGSIPMSSTEISLFATVTAPKIISFWCAGFINQSLILVLPLLLDLVESRPPSVVASPSLTTPPLALCLSLPASPCTARASSVRTQCECHPMADERAELRRLLRQHKQQTAAAQLQTRVSDKLAAYDERGQLSCIICKLALARDAWPQHATSKQHALVRPAHSASRVPPCLVRVAGC